MLGWEFPPFFSGGLGVATYGMVKALSPKVEIKLIIPNNSGNIAFSNVNIVGLNTSVAQELNLETLQFSYANLVSELHSIPLTLSPYHHVNEEILKNKLDELDTAITKQKKLETIHTIFAEKEIYGQDIVYKISLYAKLVGQLAQHEKFNVIHAHDWITFPAGLHVKQLTNKPLILHVHSLETDRAGETIQNEIYQLEKEAMTAADRIVSVSNLRRNKSSNITVSMEQKFRCSQRYRTSRKTSSNASPTR